VTATTTQSPRCAKITTFAKSILEAPVVEIFASFAALVVEPLAVTETETGKEHP
jgi:hypothetical protein